MVIYGVGTFLRAWVQGQTDLAALLTDASNGLKVSPWQSAEGVLPPRMTYVQISGSNVRTYQGATGLSRARVQLDYWGRTYSEAGQIARLVKGTVIDRRLDGYTGTLGNVTVKACILVDERDASVAPVHGEQTGYFSVSQDYLIWFAER